MMVIEFDWIKQEWLSKGEPYFQYTVYMGLIAIAYNIKLEYREEFLDSMPDHLKNES